MNNNKVTNQLGKIIKQLLTYDVILLLDTHFEIYKNIYSYVS